MFGGVVVFLFVSLLAEINGQVDDCTIDPCMNGGVCIDAMIGCDCQDGFIGYFCQQGIYILYRCNYKVANKHLTERTITIKELSFKINSLMLMNAWMTVFLNRFVISLWNHNYLCSC